MKTLAEANAALQTLKSIICPAQFRTLIDLMRRSEEAQYFRDLVCEYANRWANMPKVYEQDGKGDQATVYFHFFEGSINAWVTEKDSEPEQLQAFGLMSTGYEPELGYINLEDLAANGIEMDLHFTPCTLSEIKAKANIR